MKIIIADCNHGFFEPEQEEAKRLHANIEYVNCSQEDIITKCQNADIIVVQRLKLDGNIIDQLPKCKVVTRYGVGLDNIDCIAMAKRQIGVVNFPGFCTAEVANHAVAAILFFHRRFDILLHQKMDLPSRWGMPVSGIDSAQDTIVGIVGLGRIGKQVSSRLQACGFKIQAADPYVSDQYMVAHDINPVSIGQIFSSSDVVTLHVPLTHETKDLVNKDMFDLMKPSGCLINTARGEIVNTQDMINFVSGARKVFIDVCDPEPPGMKVLGNPYIHVTPHCAFYSSRSLDYLKRNVVIKSVEKYNDMQSNTDSKT